MIRKRNFWIMLLVDLSIVIVAYYLSYFLRFDWEIPQTHIRNFLYTAVWIVPLKLASFYIFGLYRGMWRYTSIDDLENLVKSCLASSCAILLILFISVRFYGFARSVFIIDLFLTFLFIGGFRIAIRLYYHRHNKRLICLSPDFENTRPKRVLIVGAGDAGEKVLRGLYDYPRLPFEPIGFVDDDPRKTGREIHNVPHHAFCYR